MMVEERQMYKEEERRLNEEMRRLAEQEIMKELRMAEDFFIRGLKTIYSHSLRIINNLATDKERKTSKKMMIIMNSKESSLLQRDRLLKRILEGGKRLVKW